MRHAVTLIATVLTIAFWNEAQAQVYCVVCSDANQNTATGTAALFYDMEALAGAGNTAAGYHALISNTTGADNVATGVQALSANTTGADNTASGAFALEANATGMYNTASGYCALCYNTSGGNNTADGVSALNFNTTGSYNTATGGYALYNNTSGSLNTASGLDALWANSTGVKNSAVGAQALYNNTTGYKNEAFGYQALFSSTTANDNTAFGAAALYSNTTGALNNAFGNYALEFNTTGVNNTAVGYAALLHNTTGSSNNVQGYYALANNTTGSSNIAIGYKAGINSTTGNSNIYIGNQGAAAEGGFIRIGNAAQHTHVVIAGISGVATGLPGATVVIDSNGMLGTISSSRRFKEEIMPLQDASERLFQLRPVTFRYKQANANGDKPIQYGLIAEEVAEVMPELAILGPDGQPQTVAYHVLPVLLLNELRKERQLVLAQAHRLDEQDRQLAELQVQAGTARALAARVAALEDSIALLAAGKAEPPVRVATAN